MKNPLPSDLGSECHKCAKILRQFIKAGIPGKGAPTDQFIPPDILARAKGVAILTVVKAGFGWAGKTGSGVVVARLPDGSWSAPTAIMTAGVSFGGQIGAEITDFVVILNTESAVKAFSQAGNLTLGGNLSVAAGPWGRTAEASGTMRNLAAVYSYSKSKGLFAGISIEGSAIMERKDANEKFYGAKVSAKDLLSGAIAVPSAVHELHSELPQGPVPDSPLAADGFATASAAGVASAGASRVPSMMPTPAATPGASPHAPPPYASGPARTAGSAPEKPPIPSFAAGTMAGISPSLVSTPATGNASSLGRTQGSAPHVPAAPAHHVPAPVHSSVPSTLSKPPPPPVPTRPQTAVALYDFVAQQPGDLGFHRGDVITVLKRGVTPESWWTGRLNGVEGSFPGNYVETTGTGATLAR
ncbi:hypothetical protein BC828DRAFT_374890 [Blastocladiella britannica]|nr:hypothetical protein BC828DRAFT_374890 [Blastocladiella britannica]